MGLTLHFSTCFYVVYILLSEKWIKKKYSRKYLSLIWGTMLTFVWRRYRRIPQDSQYEVRDLNLRTLEYRKRNATHSTLNSLTLSLTRGLLVLIFFICSSAVCIRIRVVGLFLVTEESWFMWCWKRRFAVGASSVQRCESSWFFWI